MRLYGSNTANARYASHGEDTAEALSRTMSTTSRTDLILHTHDTSRRKTEADREISLRYAGNAIRNCIQVNGIFLIRKDFKMRRNGSTPG